MEDGFDPIRHTVSCKCAADSGMRNAITKNGQMEKVMTAIVKPQLFTLTDSDTATSNTQFTGGNIASVTGHLLSYDADEADEGLFFVDAVDIAEEIPVTNYSIVKPSVISFLIPSIPLTSGEGYLEIRTRIGKPGDDLFTYRLPIKMANV